MRRDFDLPEDDVLFLVESGLNWETVNGNGMQWLLITEFPVPAGYNVSQVNLAIKIETGYPRTPLDMAYFYPALQRTDGYPIRALSIQMIDAKSYQRWSRHRTPANPWRVGIDDLSSHITLVSFWFEQEFLKHPNGITA